MRVQPYNVEWIDRDDNAWEEIALVVARSASEAERKAHALLSQREDFQKIELVELTD